MSGVIQSRRGLGEGGGDFGLDRGPRGPCGRVPVLLAGAEGACEGSVGRQGV